MPLAVTISLFICFLVCFGISAALTLMVPYYLIQLESPLPQAFIYVGWNSAKYVMAVGTFSILLYRSVSWFSPHLLSDARVSPALGTER